VTAADDRLADALVLRGDDLGTGWVARAEVDDAGVAGVVTACVDDDFPHGHLVAAADGAPWTRSPAGFAYGAAFVFDDDTAAAAALDVLARPTFGERFGAEVAGDVGAAQPPSTWLGGVAGTETDGDATVHRLTFAGGDLGGVLPVHVDLAVARAGRVVVVVWLGASPERFPVGERRRIVDRLRSRAG
jgi:hypothetical protein